MDYMLGYTFADCYKKMTTPYEMQDPIETMFSKIDDGVRYAIAEGGGGIPMVKPSMSTSTFFWSWQHV
jgi:hypothetical protein